MQKSLKFIIVLIMIVAITVGIIYITAPYWLFPKKRLVVYAAGSLTIPLEQLEKDFEAMHPDVDVVLHFAGSRQLAKEIIDLNATPDIYASADYRLMSMLLKKNLIDWYLVFARNEMVIAYTDNSKYADEINSTNWYKILNRTDVTFGHSDPNLDPCGYRSIIVLKLADLYYNTSGAIYKWLEVEKNKTGTLIIRPKSVDLLSLLESGELDYAFEYRSVAVQHHLRFIELPPQINLGYLEYDDFYKKVNVTLSGGQVMYGEAIAYGITILKNAKNKDLAIEFLKVLIEERDKILDANGQPSIYPLLAYNYSTLPDEIKPHAKPMS